MTTRGPCRPSRSPRQHHHSHRARRAARGARARPLFPRLRALWSMLVLAGAPAPPLPSGVLGTATIVVVALLARRLAGNAAGLIAAGIVALYPQVWINAGMILSETMAIFM